MSNRIAVVDTYSPATLANRLAELDLPGRRSKTAITRLRAERRRLNTQPAPAPSLIDRFNAWLVDRYSDEIRRRGGETSIAEGSKASALLDKPLTVADRRGGLTLLRVEGWRYYSRNFGSRRATLAYLCGRDDNGDWAARIPGTITTVRDALDWLTPAEVRDAITAGTKVRRQGDIYVLPAKRDTPTGPVGRPDETGHLSHHWDAGKRTLTHRPRDGRRHRTLRLGKGPVKFVQQSAYGHGRGAGRGSAD
ncbi:hypothetical protein [Micromonospora aurantiaca (nom. illeg.)]|uniref:hypothetical protein n=1 Tax=Micromonospora aurantiaca (nom. illeg.) TaxID=47850 RepID=UPI0033E6AE61